MLIDRHLSNKAQKKFIELTQAIEEVGDVACQSFPDMMFEEQDNIEARRTQATIKAICRECPVKDLCLDYAIEAREEYGIWGGLTTKERNELIRFARQPWTK
jgi:WhiB family redox-sensing transcriptional regulator